MRAQDAERIYQAARDQYICEHRPPAAADVLNTLPRDIATFTGRDDEIETVVAGVAHAQRSGDPIMVHAIDGMPGVGKTTLAVHLGYRLADHFPDGQLFLDLHGHTIDQAPVEPATALGRLLENRGVRPGDVPAGLDQRAALWRARMAGRSLLLIMDDAAGIHQVEPLLPGAGGCLVLITSRMRLAGLSARPGAQTLPLDSLPPEDAARLFLRLVDRPVPTSQLHAVDSLVERCGYLPLAIALLAARLKPEKLWMVSDLVEELTESTDRLGAMRVGGITVAAAFDLSCRQLPVDRRRFLRRLGLHPGTDFDAYAAAALADISVTEARRHLDALYDDHLVAQPIHGRYRLHDLVRDYTRTLMDPDAASEADNSPAVLRVLDFYLQAAGVAEHLITSPDTARSDLPVDSRCTPPSLDTPARAMAWLHTETANLLACAGYARSRGDDVRLIGLTAVVAAHLLRNGPWEHAIDLHQAAAEAAGRLHDHAARADALHHLGEQLRRTGDYRGAETALREAFDLFGEMGSRQRQAGVLDELAGVHRLTWNLSAATEALQEALFIYQNLNDCRGRGRILNSLAMIRWLADDYPGAVEAADEALHTFADLGDRHGQADALFRLSLVCRANDDYAAAVDLTRQALTLYRQVGNRLGVAHVSRSLGFLKTITADLDAAASATREALTIYQELGEPVGQANALHQLATIAWRRGELSRAAQVLHHALALFRDTGDRVGQAAATLSLGIVWRLTTDLIPAADALHDALQMYHQLGSRTGEAEVRNEIGALELDRGNTAHARTQYQCALGLAVETHSLLEKARAHEGLGRCALAAEDIQSGLIHLREASAIYQRIGAPQAARTASELSQLQTPPPSTPPSVTTAGPDHIHPGRTGPAPRR